MALDPVTALLDIGGKVIDRIWPDPAQAASAKLELLKLQQSGELQQIAGQLAINQEEAKSPSVFVAGARPFILWVCGVAFAYCSIVEPVARFVATVVFHYAGAYPAIDTNLTLQVLGGLLGLGALRSWDKKNGVA
jgi:hypothetical protein